MSNEIKKLFASKSVMVVGVSDTPTNLGRNIVENLDRFHFNGEIYLVGQEGGSLNDRKIYRSVDEVDNIPELAVFLIPARAIPDALEACGQMGVHYAVIESGGFSEYSEKNRTLEKNLLDIAKRWNIRFVGPNCISICNLENGLVLPFMPVYPNFVNKGHVSVVSQSGGVIGNFLKLSSCENIGFNKLMSIGNKLDLDENDYLEFLISDPGTHIIGLYLESISNGRRLMTLAASTDKPIIILKSNINQASHEIAQFHTAALAGDDQVVETALKQAGLHRVQNIQEMIDCFKVFSLPLMKGLNLAILSRSGGQAVISADAAYRYGFNLARFSDHIFNVVKQGSRSGVIRITNPLDLGDIFDLDFYIKIMEQILNEKEVDGLILRHDYQRVVDTPATQKLIRAAQNMSLQYQKPVLVCLAPEYDEWFLMKHTTDFPIFTEPDQALKALAISLRHFKYRATHPGRQLKIYESRSRSALPHVRPSRLMNLDEVFDLLKSYHLPVADYAIVKNVEDALRAAKKIGYPVALKIAMPNIIHKTDVKGVKLNIASSFELKEAFKEMKADEFIIQQMAPVGQEIIIGGRQDHEFGPIVLFGLGGIFVEVFEDVALRVAPIDESEAERVVEEINGAALLKGFRGQPPCDIKAIIKSLVNVSRLLVEHPEIQNLDINPLIVLLKDRGCLVVDAKMAVNT